MTFNSSNLWVANSNLLGGAGPGFVSEYLPGQLAVSGHPTPNITLTDPTQFVSPTGVVFDSAGDLFVAVDSTRFAVGPVWVFKAATIASLSPGTNTIKADAKLSDSTTVESINGAFDSTGNLWVADCGANSTGEIYMFGKAILTTGAASATTVFQSASITTPNGTENTIDCPVGIVFDAQGNLWYTNFVSRKVDGAVGEFTASQLKAVGKSTPTPNIFLDGSPGGANFDGPIGLTFGPPA
jgi:secreted PhoX family phosphatase